MKRKGVQIPLCLIRALLRAAHQECRPGRADLADVFGPRLIVAPFEETVVMDTDLLAWRPN